MWHAKHDFEYMFSNRRTKIKEAEEKGIIPIIPTIYIYNILTRGKKKVTKSNKKKFIHKFKYL